LCDLDEEWDDGLALGIILELFLVVPVLAQSPHGHLVSPCHGEEGSRQTLGHDGEADPGPDLIGVVGAGAEVEEASQGV